MRETLGDPELGGEIDLGDVPRLTQLRERDRVFHRTPVLGDVCDPLGV